MVIATGAAQLVFGLASNSLISGNQYIQIGGSADGTTIKAGGDQDILGGGIATNTTVDGGTQNVFGVAIQTTVANGGFQHVHNNAFNTIVDAGGEQNVYIDGSATGYAQNNDNTGGTLTVSDGTHVATLHLLGQYSAADFALSSDGHGGTLITDPAVAQQAQLAPALHG
ncbi:hypothetical protein [Bradyrhizobium japonicum]|uniref:hypothetical protein n=1 Tax=Bradyrhizobium japonicum TaxID=375 RepID=UPI000456BC9A|nr:hypothetical protein [Bradyrhizobium japonicum]AHY53537.1 hypothetical protein BJS_00917 [Bradyrhizobium japonicum SEMIA 5079]MCD9106251.1 hypothetical protein [Bradyrhizobium japonicum]MCD9252689.1 hypothetical protein [Bradyrhizobium japonicum SEMIA 5079]MCD9817380.1 hypothetical protein [Bradyrhizobium japonicum]MCD9890480.1 hypothetical protein [Bradyrhizobium japonicum]